MGRVLSMHLHSRQERMSSGTKDVDSVDSKIVGAALDALAQLGWADGLIAEKQGVDASQWSKQKTGAANHHMSVQRLEKLGPEFLRAFAVALCRRAGLRVAEPDLRRQALSRAIRALGDAVEAMEQEHPQLDLFPRERVG